ncbi:MAG: glycosyltransferase [Streptococcaceae bacterium]|jgi:glycosyltransferase involved in cell wall biosynthesis|nr:glycosyltransferase [Streptococcaceae bacterium]
MKKILFTVDYLGMGGIERVTSIISNELSKDHEVNIFGAYSAIQEYSTKAKYLFKKRNFFQNLLLYITVAVDRVMNILFKRTCRIFWYIRNQSLIQHLKKNSYDTIVLAGVAMYAATYIRKICPNAKIFMWIHLSFDYFFECGGQLEALAPWFIENVKIANQVVVLTDTSKEQYLKFSDSVIKIHNPVSFRNQEEIVNLNEKVIAFTARYQIWCKGFDRLMQVVAKLPVGWKIAIAGDGTKIDKIILHWFIKKNCAQNKIILKGAIYGKSLINHYQNSSFYVMTSRSEELPMVMIEAMSFGLPVIAFKQPGSKEIIGKNEYGILVENGNIEEMLEKINQLIESSDLREKYSILSKKRASHFQIGPIMEQWREII